MKYIKKENEEAIDLVSWYVNSCWNDDESSYCGLDYSYIRKIGLTGYLLDEQSYYCCYCMRVIDLDNVTLEHIIPHSTETEEEFISYTSETPLLADNVMLTKTFLQFKQKQANLPAPHVVAYHNLVASCDGHCTDSKSAICCNEIRGNKYIVPLFYRETISGEISYLKGGILAPVFEEGTEEYKTINHVRLNTDILTKIRKIWFRVSRYFVLEDIQNALSKPEKREGILSELTDHTETDLFTTFQNETYWKILWDYRWFYDYYRKAFPIS